MMDPVGGPGFGLLVGMAWLWIRWLIDYQAPRNGPLSAGLLGQTQQGHTAGSSQ